jgi:hypothetical protein
MYGTGQNAMRIAVKKLATPRGIEVSNTCGNVEEGDIKACQT